MAELPSVNPETVITTRTTRFATKDLSEIDERIRNERRTGVLHVHYNSGGKCTLEFVEKDKSSS